MFPVGQGWRVVVEFAKNVSALVTAAKTSPRERQDGWLDLAKNVSAQLDSAKNVSESFANANMFPVGQGWRVVIEFAKNVSAPVDCSKNVSARIGTKGANSVC